jgi:hypothetical protein
MAFHSPNGPNMVIVRYVMYNVWSVAKLESYITSYQPGGPPLHVLRILLGHGRIAPPAYAQCLARLASILFGLGHVKPVNVVVAELLQHIPPGHLTVQQVEKKNFSQILNSMIRVLRLPPKRKGIPIFIFCEYWSSCITSNYNMSLNSHKKIAELRITRPFLPFSLFNRGNRC